jgi:acetyl-CoA C-acetyltransferase
VATSVVVAGARTPVGRLLGSLSSLSAVELGSIALAAAVQRAAIPAADVDAVILGNVVQAGNGPNPARQVSVGAGLPMSVPAMTINRLCLSGLTSIGLANQAILSGRYDVVAVGGTESMSGAPHLLPGSRRGWKYGSVSAQDSLDRDALICAFDGETMGAATQRYQQPLSISREDQDVWAARSHARATDAQKSGAFADEITPVEIAGRGGSTFVEMDEGIRPDTTVERLAALRPAFDRDGSITAGNSSPLSDGACALLVTSKEYAERHGLTWLAEIGGHGEVAGPDPSLLLQPAGAIRDALNRDGSAVLDDLDLLEINEAFASVTIASLRALGVDEARVNVNGGAIALGHPVGMSGARLVLTLALELRRRGGGTGAVALCGGGGQGEAMILRVPAG